MTQAKTLSVTRQIVLLCILVVPLLAAGWLFTRVIGDDDTEASGQRRNSGPRAVMAATASLRTVPEEIEAFGKLRAWRSIDVTTETSGRVTSVNFSGGQKVEAGDVLLTLDSELQQADVDEARAQLQLLQLDVERAQQLKKRQAGSQQAVDSVRAQLAAAQAELDRTGKLLEQRTLTAGFSGVTGLPQVTVGEYISSSTVVTSLDDLDTMRVDFELPESTYRKVARDQPVQITAAALLQEQFTGKVSEIDSRVDANSGTFGVRALLPNDGQSLRAGMFVQVKLTVGELDVLLVPEQALVPRGVRNYVVTIDDGVATQRDVTIGRRLSGMVEITSGVDAGAQVVTRGHTRLKNGNPVEIKDDLTTAPVSQ